MTWMNDYTDEIERLHREVRMSGGDWDALIATAATTTWRMVDVWTGIVRPYLTGGPNHHGTQGAIIQATYIRFCGEA